LRTSSSAASQPSKVNRINSLQDDGDGLAVKPLIFNGLRSSRPHWTISATGPQRKPADAVTALNTADRISG
jgi:hypothetical protein